jgi:hypothetical protein
MPAALPSTLRPAKPHAGRRWALSAALAATAAFAITATSAAPSGTEPAASASVEPAATSAVPEKAARVRCWGQLVDIHGVEATASAPASFEFVVRMHDGSMHTGASQGLDSWQVGDHILVFGCVPAAATGK